jgi:hypothetical protein
MITDEVQIPEIIPICANDKADIYLWRALELVEKEKKLKRICRLVNLLRAENALLKQERNRNMEILKELHHHPDFKNDFNAKYALMVARVKIKKERLI